MAGAISQLQQATVLMDITESESDEYKAFVALQDVLAKQLKYCATSAANFAYGAELIRDDAFERVFDRDMAPKSDVFKVLYLLNSVRNNIRRAESRDDAKAKMTQFLDCLRSEVVFDELVKSLGELRAQFRVFFVWLTNCMVLLMATFEGRHCVPFPNRS